jgi:pimeloyl-ACP methyl ester carboxylesterase
MTAPQPDFSDAAQPADDVAAAIKPVKRVVVVDGIPMSGLLAEAPNPRATVVAIHGGSTTSAYFDCPGHPRLSLLRLGSALGFTVIALDRPGVGSSAVYGDEFSDPARRVDLVYRAADQVLGSRSRGAGVFVLAHSNGTELGLRLAADDRGATLLGLEVSATGLRQTPAARGVLASAGPGRVPPGLRDLLWQPAHLYPDDVFGGARIRGAPAPGYQGATIASWTRDFATLAGRIRIPVRFSLGEQENLWCSDPAEMADVASKFTASPRVVVHLQSAAGHNLSLGFTAAAYHMSVLSFVEECAVARPTMDSGLEAQ